MSTSSSRRSSACRSFTSTRFARSCRRSAVTLGELIRATESKFLAARLHYGHGTDNAYDEAAYLVLRSLQLPFDEDLDQELTSSQAARVNALAKKRVQGRIPVAYLLKEAWLD